MAGEFAAVDAGKRLRRFVDAAMARSDEVRTISALCRRAHLNRNTIYDWFTGEAVPSPAGMAKLAAALDVGVGDLYAAYDGRADIPTTTDAALNDLAHDIRANTEAIQDLLGRLGAVADRAIAEEIAEALARRRRSRQDEKVVTVGR